MGREARGKRAGISGGDGQHGAHEDEGDARPMLVIPGQSRAALERSAFRLQLAYPSFGAISR